MFLSVSFNSLSLSLSPIYSSLTWRKTTVSHKLLRVFSSVCLRVLLFFYFHLFGKAESKNDFISSRYVTVSLRAKLVWVWLCLCLSILWGVQLGLMWVAYTSIYVRLDVSSLKVLSYTKLDTQCNHVQLQVI